MIRRNGKLEKATWDEAMGLIVDKSQDVIKRLTSHAIAFVCGDVESCVGNKD